MASLSRYRYDTIPDRIRVKDTDGNAVDITGCTFTLTINRERQPIDMSQQIAAVSGTIVSAVLGTVEFVFSALQADQEAGPYYYDIKTINALAQIHTISRGSYVFRQTVHQ